MKGSVIIIGFFGAGILAGTLGPLPGNLPVADYTVYALYALLLCVGISLGGDSHVWATLRDHRNLSWVLVPVLVALGSLAGVAATCWLFPTMSLRSALAVGAGFGYYSLSSVLITQAHSEALGVVALLSNLIREIGTLLLAPLLVRYFGKLAPIASGGATAMDSTLPVIVRFAGKEYAVVALFSGMTLTAAVPVLVLAILTA